MIMMDGDVSSELVVKMASDLDRQGWARLPSLVSRSECEHIVSYYDDQSHFRSRVVMARHNFGRGEYQYFRYPLPPLVQSLRSNFYELLAPIANRWNAAMGINVDFPVSHSDFLARCHAGGQLRPTPLLLRYQPGDYNCLHQDVYGEHIFPLQMAILLSDPGADFEGGEFVLTEQRPRMQSRVSVVPFQQGDAVVFAVRNRPVQGAHGIYRTALRHGVSEIRSGHRHTLGIIFHDAS
jgi:uncharacterized protein